MHLVYALVRWDVKPNIGIVLRFFVTLIKVAIL